MGARPLAALIAAALAGAPACAHGQARHAGGWEVRYAVEGHCVRTEHHDVDGFWTSALRCRWPTHGEGEWVVTSRCHGQGGEAAEVVSGDLGEAQRLGTGGSIPGGWRWPSRAEALLAAGHMARCEGMEGHALEQSLEEGRKVPWAERAWRTEEGGEALTMEAVSGRSGGPNDPTERSFRATDGGVGQGSAPTIEVRCGKGAGEARAWIEVPPFETDPEAYRKGEGSWLMATGWRMAGGHYYNAKGAVALEGEVGRIGEQDVDVARKAVVERGTSHYRADVDAGVVRRAVQTGLPFEMEVVALKTSQGLRATAWFEPGAEALGVFERCRGRRDG